MTRTQRSQCLQTAAGDVLTAIGALRRSALHHGKNRLYPGWAAESRERARLWRVALLAVKEAVRK